MGLDKNKVVLEKHNDKWAEMFRAEEKELRKIFGDLALSIEHVGSTSIPGIMAKPLVDIQVGLRKLEDFEKVRAKFEHEPYSVKPDPSPDEQLVRKGPEENRIYLIHITAVDSDRFKNTLLFRDYMRAHPDKAREYEALKKELAAKYANDRPMYTASKNDFIQAVLKEARAK